MNDGPKQISMFSSAELHVCPSALPDSETVWLTLEETSHLSILRSLNATAPSGWYGKTSPEHTRQLHTSLPIHVDRKTSYEWEPETGNLSLTLTNQKKTMLSDASWPDFKNSGMGSPTELLTLNTSEYPSAAAVCSLLDVLETGDVPQKYYLSPKACAGILRRAEKRGKELPTMLHRALEQVAQASSGLATAEDKTA